MHGVTQSVIIGSMKNATIPENVAAQADIVRHTVAANLSALLDEQRWSRRAAATALGLTHRYVNSRATGDVELSSSDLAMFARFLNVPISRFFVATQNGPETFASGPRLLPDLDSNQEPADLPLAPEWRPVVALDSRRMHLRPMLERDTLAPVTRLHASI